MTLFGRFHDQPEIDNIRDDKKPIMILKYNKNKRIMDTSDQIVKAYSRKRMSRRIAQYSFFTISLTTMP